VSAELCSCSVSCLLDVVLIILHPHAAADDVVEDDLLFSL